MRACRGSGSTVEAPRPHLRCGVVSGYGERFASCEAALCVRACRDRVDWAGLRTPPPLQEPRRCGGCFASCGRPYACARVWDRVDCARLRTRPPLQEPRRAVPDRPTLQRLESVTGPEASTGTREQESAARIGRGFLPDGGLDNDHCAPSHHTAVPLCDWSERPPFAGKLASTAVVKHGRPRTAVPAADTRLTDLTVRRPGRTFSGGRG